MKRIISTILSVVLTIIAVTGILSPVPVEAASANIAEGTYTISTALNSKMVLDIAGGSTANKANVQIYKSNNSAAQQFKIAKYGSYYRIINVKSNRVLDVAGGSKANKANVQQYGWNKTNAQLWNIVSAGGGYYYIINVGSKKALDVAGGKTANKTNVWQYNKNNTKAQKWKLTAIKKSSSSSSTTKTESTETKIQKLLKPTTYEYTTAWDGMNATKAKATNTKSPANLANGTYIIAGLGTYTSSKDKAFAAKNTYSVTKPLFKGEKTSNMSVQKIDSTHKDVTQQWVITSLGKGLYKVINKKTGLALDVQGGKSANVQKSVFPTIQMYKWNNSNAQKWYIIKNHNDSYTFVSSIDYNTTMVCYGMNTIGNYLIGSEYNGSVNGSNSFRLIKIG